jgi:hypothetical protein
MQSYGNFEQDAQILRKSMKGLGTDEDTIISLTSSRSNAQRQTIRLTYKSAFGRDLLEDFEDELGGDFRKVVKGMWMSPVEYDVEEIRNAVQGVGTNEDTLSEMLGTRRVGRIRDIIKVYQQKYNEKLEDRILDETSGDYQKLLVSLLSCNRDESNNVDQNLVNQDAKDLYDAGEGKWGTNESVFIRIFGLRNVPHLTELNKVYYITHKKTLNEVVESEFSGDMKILLQTIIHSHLNPADYFATRIYNACKVLGTNDSVLIRTLIITDECLLSHIKDLYPKKYGMTLLAQVEDETSGDYKKMLLGLINSP